MNLRKRPKTCSLKEIIPPSRAIAGVIAFDKAATSSTPTRSSQPRWTKTWPPGNGRLRYRRSRS